LGIKVWVYDRRNGPDAFYPPRKASENWAVRAWPVVGKGNINTDRRSESFFLHHYSVFSSLLIGKKPREQGVYTFLICFEFFFGWETNYILRAAKSLVVGIIWVFLGFSIKGALTSWLRRLLEKKRVRAQW